MTTIDDMNPGRDLRAEARQVVLGAVEKARGESNRRGINTIMNAIDAWVGGTDGIFRLLGHPSPERPQEVFDGVSDALSEIDPSTVTPSQALALITVTNAVRSRIENWQDFVDHTYDHFKLTMGEEKARSNLVGFIK